MTGPRLPLLERSTRALETCGYCPKLCRAACPVSEADRRETLTPWGKMSMAWLASRGDVEVEASIARTAWACTGCLACRERCDHSNPVARTLRDARADFSAVGLAPAPARAVVDGHEGRLREVGAAVERLRALPGVAATAPRALLLGCGYARALPAVAEDAVRVAVALAGPVRLVAGCCGAPLADAGEPRRAEAARRALEAEVGSAELVVVDPGCASELDGRPVRLLVDVVADGFERLRGVPELAASDVRWHDPCRLGRGLGRFEEPRRVLGRALGRPPGELSRSGRAGLCSGGGGLVPITFPEVSVRTARRVIDDHEALGGGVLVAGCAASHVRFVRSGARVLDLMTVARRALEADG